MARRDVELAGELSMHASMRSARDIESDQRAPPRQPHLYHVTFTCIMRASFVHIYTCIMYTYTYIRIQRFATAFKKRMSRFEQSEWRSTV